jgi:hypothetical protein
MALRHSGLPSPLLGKCPRNRVKIIHSSLNFRYTHSEPVVNAFAVMLGDNEFARGKIFRSQFFRIRVGGNDEIAIYYTCDYFVDIGVDVMWRRWLRDWADSNGAAAATCADSEIVFFCAWEGFG